MNVLTVIYGSKLSLNYLGILIITQEKGRRRNEE